MTRLPRYLVTLCILLVFAAIDLVLGGAITRMVDQPFRAVIPRAASDFLSEVLFAVILYVLIGWILDVVVDTVSAQDRIPEAIIEWDELVSTASTAWTKWFFGALSLLLVLALPGSIAGAIPAALWPSALLLVWTLPGNPISPPAPLPRPSRRANIPAKESGDPSLRLTLDTREKDLVEYLRQSPGYRGQISVVKTRDAQTAKPYGGKVPFDERSPAWYALPLQEGQTSLYEHQGRFAAMVRERRTVALATALGSGRMSILLPVILDFVLSKGSAVLVLAPDAASCRAGYEHLKRTLRSTRWGWSVIMADYSDLGKVDKAAGTDPQIVFATFEVAHRRLLPDSSTRWAPFLNGINLIVTLRTERLSGVYGANCAMVLRRLLRVCAAHGAKPKLVALLRPVANAHIFLTSLFHETFQTDAVHTEDTAPKPSQTVLFWNPVEAATEKLALSRSDYAVEAQQLALKLSSAGRRVIVYAGAVPLTTADIGAVQQTLSRIPVVQEISDREFGEKIQSFDTVVITGAPGPYTLLHHDLAHLGSGAAGSALICVVPPHQPLARYFLRRPELFFQSRDPNESPRSEFAELPEVALTLDNEQVVRKHLLAAAAELTLDEDDVKAYFGPVGSKLLVTLLKEGLVAEEEARHAEDRHMVATKKYRSISHDASDWSLDTAACDVVWLVNSYTREPLRQIEAATADNVAYQGAVMVIGGERFQVARNPGDLQRREISLEPGVQWLGSSSIRNLTLRTMEDAPSPRALMQINGGLQFSVRMGLLNLETTVTGVHCFDASALNGHLRLGRTVGGPALTAQLTTQGLVISFEGMESDQSIEGAVHTLAHLGHVVVPLLVTCGVDEIGVGYVGHVPTTEGSLSTPSVVFFDLVPGGNGAVFTLRRHLDSFFRIAHDILESCACTNGCTGCIHILQCHSATPNEGLDKQAAKKLLGQVLNLDQTVDAQGKVSREETLRVIRSLVLEQMANRLGIRITSVAPVRFFDKTESARNIAGLCYHAPPQVAVRPDTYARLIAVLAHEYTHNWQAEPGNMDPSLRGKDVPFDGKLFSEGFAQWVEYKLHDVFGVDNDAERLTFTSFDEYSEGFLVFRRLEDEGGVERVLEFLRQPDEPSAWPTLYQRAGVNDRAFDRWKELKDAEKELLPDDWEGMSTFSDTGAST